MRPFDIYNATFTWNNCPDMRPWLIIEFRTDNLVGCLPIASQCYGGSCFPIEIQDVDFPATGLKKSCHILDDRIYDLSLDCFGRLRGRLQGDLLRRFQDYSGL